MKDSLSDSIEFKGNRKVAFMILLAIILLALVLFKPILVGLFFLVVCLLKAILTFVILGLLLIGGFYLALIVEWAAKTLFTNAQPNFPELKVDWPYGEKDIPDYSD